MKNTLATSLAVRKTLSGLQTSCSTTEKHNSLQETAIKVQLLTVD